MIVLMTLGILCILATDRTHAITKRNLTPEQQFEHINFATRQLNARYAKKLEKINDSGRHLKAFLEDEIGKLLDFLDSLGEGQHVSVDKHQVPDVIFGSERFRAPKRTTNHYISKRKAANVYKKQCWRRRRCNLGSGIYGECFTNAVKFAMSFGWDEIDSVTFDDTEKYAAVMYPHNMCSVVNNLDQRIMNLYFGRRMNVERNYRAPYALQMSNALDKIIQIIEDTSKEEKDDCKQLPRETFLLGNGSILNCNEKCVICGLKGMTSLPEIHVQPDRGYGTAEAKIPMQVPPLTVDMTQEDEDGSKQDVKYNINNVNVFANVTFNTGDEYKFKEVNIDWTKIGGIEGILGKGKLTKDQQNKIKGAIGKVVQEQLKDQMKKLNFDIGEKIKAALKKG